MTIFHLTWMDLKIPWSLSPRGQLTLCVTWYGVHTMVLKACLMSKAALGGHSHMMKLGRRWGIFMGTLSAQCLTCQGIVHRAAQPHSPFAAPHLSSLQLNWVNLLSHLRSVPATQTGAATALNQEPPSQPQRDGLVLTLLIHPRGFHSSVWSELMWDQPYSECVTHMTLTQSCKRLWVSAVGSLGTPENSS